MAKNFVVDTVSFRSYFKEIFDEAHYKVSEKAIKIIDDGFNDNGDIRISIPSIVFVEIFAKTFHSEEFQARFKNEIFSKILDRNIEIKPIDKEVLENVALIGNNLENHDKIILASAMTLDCPLITCDSKILDFVKKNPWVKILS